MSSITLFSTYPEILSGFEGLDSQQNLIYILCEEQGRVQSEFVIEYRSLKEVIQAAHLRYPDRLDGGVCKKDPVRMVVMYRGANYRVLAQTIPHNVPHANETFYWLEVEEGNPYCNLSLPGLQVSPHMMWSGQIDFPNPPSDLSISFYWNIKDALLSKCHNYRTQYFSSGALDLGARGMVYDYQVFSQYQPWNYKDLVTIRNTGKTVPHKPYTGRLNVEDSWKWLDNEGFEPPRNRMGRPLRYKDVPEVCADFDQGLSFFRTILECVSFDKLSIGNSAFDTSYLHDVTFIYADVSYSRFNESDLTLCDFTYTDLTGSIMTAQMTGCRFTGANLTNADLSSSCINGCSFWQANMKGTKLTQEQLQSVSLSNTQLQQIKVHVPSTR